MSEPMDKITDLPKFPASGRQDKKSDESTSSDDPMLGGLTAETSPQDHGKKELDDQEAFFYYYGLTKSDRSHPRLIARSGNDPFHIEFEFSGGWHLPREDMRKTMSPVRYGSHLITSLYDCGVREKIREIFQEISWKFIDVARVGRKPRAEDNDVFILVTVPKEEKVDYTTALQLVTQGHNYLNECGLGDVHVEMKEGTYTQLVGFDPFRTVMYEHVTRIGTSVGVSYNDAGKSKCSSGTFGLYLRLGSNPMLYGLTCRHVVFPDSRPPPGGTKSAYMHAGEDLIAEAPSSADHQEEVDACTFSLEGVEDDFTFPGGPKEQQEAMGSFISKNTKYEIDRYHEQKHQLEERLAVIKGFDRKVGHIYAACADDISSTGGIKDWALLKTDSQRFEHHSLNQDLFNKLPCPPSRSPLKSEFRKKYLELQEDLKKEDQVQVKNFRFPIREVMPLSEIMQPTVRPIPQVGEDERHCYPCLRVLKCGRTTGWTFAETATIRSDCQRTKGQITKELFIPNISGLAPFSAKGDSGSVIFDFRARAVGMVHGGSGRQDSLEFDATYATPMEDLLKDIEQELGVTVSLP